MKNMRILWFANSPCGSVRRNKMETIAGGWLISLEDEIKKHFDIELNVAFFSNVKEAPFEYEGVHYYPMFFPMASTKIGRVLNRYKTVDYIDHKMLPVMLDVVKDTHPDLIHIHGTEERFGLIQNYIKDIPIVFSIQGLIAPYTEKYFSGLPSKNVYRNESLFDKLRKISYYDDYKNFKFRAKREIGYLNKAKYIFGRTFWDKTITGMLNVNRKYYVVDEILRLPFYQTKWNSLSFSNGNFKIISTISGGIYKGYETVLKTAALLKQNTKLNFEWIIAGYDDQSKCVQIAERYTKIKSSSVNVKFMGRVDAEKLSKMLSCSDVYVHVSHIENSPNSVCEAMLLGMPVIASYAGGTCSMLENEKEGILVQDGDPYIYAGAIVYIYTHFEKAKVYGENARKRALERHNPNRIGKQLLDAYKNIESDYMESTQHVDAFDGNIKK